MVKKSRKKLTADSVIEMIRHLEPEQLLSLADKLFSNVRIRKELYSGMTGKALTEAKARVPHIDELKKDAREVDEKKPNFGLRLDGSSNVKALVSGLLMRGLHTPGTLPHLLYVSSYYWRFRWQLRNSPPRMTERDLRIVKLKDEEGQSYRQIADQLDMGEKAVEKAYKRMKAKLP